MAPKLIIVVNKRVFKIKIPSTYNQRDTNLSDSEDDYRTSCQNVSHCQQQPYLYLTNY